MSRPSVALATLVACLLVACGRDPILEKAEKDAAARAEAARGGGSAVGDAGDENRARTSATQAGSGAQPTSGSTEAGTPGVAGQPTPGAAGQPTPGAAGQPTPGPPGEPAPGIPEEPAPGDPRVPPPGGKPGDPAPGIPGEPAPGVPTQPAPGDPIAAQGPTVDVSGTVAFPGYTGGEVRVTAFDGDHTAGARARPKVVGMARIARPGAFTLKVPADVASVYVEASVDEDGDGRPGPLDPQGHADRYPVRPRGEAVSGLTVAIGRREPPPGGTKKDF